MKHLQEAAVADMLSEDKIFRRLAVADLEIVIGVKESKQRNEDDRGCKALSKMEDVVESSSYAGSEGEKQRGFGLVLGSLLFLKGLGFGLNVHRCLMSTISSCDRTTSHKLKLVDPAMRSSRYYHSSAQALMTCSILECLSL